jgi:hypothetical protein
LKEELLVPYLQAKQKREEARVATWEKKKEEATLKGGKGEEGGGGREGKGEEER